MSRELTHQDVAAIHHMLHAEDGRPRADGTFVVTVRGGHIAAVSTMTKRVTAAQLSETASTDIVYPRMISTDPRRND